MGNPLSVWLAAEDAVSSVVSQTANTVADQVADGMVMLQTIAMGLGIVFVGLICLIVICSATGAAVRRLEGLQKAPTAPAAPAPVATPVPTAAPALPAEKRGELSAVIAATVAEELGTDVAGIRIVSIKKV